MQSAVEFDSFLQRYIDVICLYMFNGKMKFVLHENKVMEKEINDQHEEMFDQEISDEDHILSNASCFGSDIENNDTIK